MQNKKSFIMYCDLKNVVDVLSDEEAWQLMKKIFSYHNWNDYEPDLPWAKIAFAWVKATLDRDANKWQEERIKRSEAWRKGGLKSGEARASKTKETEAKRRSASKNEANEADSVNVNVSVNDNVNVIKDNKPQKRIFAEDSFEYQIALWYLDQVKENAQIQYQLKKKPEDILLSEWADDVRKLCELDWLTQEQIRVLFKATQEDTFWKDKILSPWKFRQKNKQWSPYFTVMMDKARQDVASQVTEHLIIK